MPDNPKNVELVDKSDAACTDDGCWRTGWLAVLREGENYGYADVNITAGQGAEIIFTVYWQDELQPMYRIDVDPAGRELTILKNFEGWLEDVGAFVYDDDGNTVDAVGKPIDPEKIDPFQPVNGAVASDQDAAQIAALMVTQPFAAEELFTHVIAVVGDLTAYTERWAHRYLRNSVGEYDPEWTSLWRPVDIGPSARAFPIEDVGPGPVVRSVEVNGWNGYYLTEEAVSALVDNSGQLQNGPFSIKSLPQSYVGEPLSIDDLPDAVQIAWYRVWNAAHITYEPNM